MLAVEYNEESKSILEKHRRIQMIKRWFQDMEHAIRIWRGVYGNIHS